MLEPEPERIYPDAVRRRQESAVNTLLVCVDGRVDPGALLPGAITLDELERRQDEFEHDRELVFYSVRPSDDELLELAREWHRRGFDRAKVLVGGVEAWKASGYPTSGQEPRVTT